MSTIAAILDNYITPIGLSPTLQRPTLVLNRNWQPINVATVARALIMLWNDSAKIVDPADYQLYDWSDWSRLVPDRDEPFIQSVRQRIRIPEVIALTKFDAMPTQTVTFSRRNVFKRDKMTCQYCGRRGRTPWETDSAQPEDQKLHTRFSNKSYLPCHVFSTLYYIFCILPRNIMWKRHGKRSF
jgi:hypothetical protein